jgi:acetyl-CoA acyltransferase 1
LRFKCQSFSNGLAVAIQTERKFSLDLHFVMEMGDNGRRASIRQHVLLRHFDAAAPTRVNQEAVLNSTSAGDFAAYQRKTVNLDDVVIVSACRTPLCRARKGGLRDTPADDLVATVLKETLARTGVEAEAVGDVVMGSVLGPSSQRANECRMAMFYAGFPESVPVHTVNRQCSSGLQAIASVASAIKAGYYTIGIAGGVETMTANPMNWEGGVNPKGFCAFWG